MRFVIPLGLVYFAEYFINQGLVSHRGPSGVAARRRASLLVGAASIDSDHLGAFPDGAPVFPRLFPVPRGAVPLVSSPFRQNSEGITSAEAV